MHRQRYCLHCGARSGDQDATVAGLIAAARGHGATATPGSSASGPSAARPPGPAAHSERGASGSGPGLRLPSPFVCVLLLALFAGFGILLGSMAAKPSGGALAADAGSHLKLVLPAAGSASGTPASSPAGAPAAEEASESEAAAAAGETESSPASAAAPSTTAAKKPTSASGGGQPSGSADGSGAGGRSSVPTPAKTLPPIKHVFVVMLSDEPYATAFGPASSSSYLSHTLEAKGELLTRYDAVAHEELANEVALISGQGPTAETAADCPNYTAITPSGVGPDEQVLGNGCVYPASTQTLAGQLAARHLTWRAYVQGTGEPGSQVGACSHPALGASDPTAVQTASTGSYATFRNPFVYFASIADSSECASNDVGLGALKGDLSSTASTPSFAYIVPDRCDDGNPTPCTPGASAGMVPAGSFLSSVVPEILGSKAYRESGLLVITVDEAPSSGEYADSSSCCGQPAFPNLPASSGAFTPRGGGTVGALLLSPYVRGGTTSSEAFNHFSLLRTIENIFSLKHIGYAAAAGVSAFEPSLFTATRSG